MRFVPVIVATALLGACAVDDGEAIRKFDACADQQRLWCDLAGRPDEVDCWNTYFDWCAPRPRLQSDNVPIPLELHAVCMDDLLGTEPDPLNHWLPDRDTVPASCQRVWQY